MEQQIVKIKNKRGVRVIPGYGLTMGVTFTMLASIFISTSKLNFEGFIQVITSRQVVSGYLVSFSCSFLAALVNAVFGMILAWALVRYDFPGDCGCRNFPYISLFR